MYINDLCKHTANNLNNNPPQRKKHFISFLEVDCYQGLRKVVHDDVTLHGLNYNMPTTYNCGANSLVYKSRTYKPPSTTNEDHMHVVVFETLSLVWNPHPVLLIQILGCMDLDIGELIIQSSFQYN